MQIYINPFPHINYQYSNWFTLKFCEWLVILILAACDILPPFDYSFLFVSIFSLLNLLKNRIIIKPKFMHVDSTDLAQFNLLVHQMWSLNLFLISTQIYELLILIIACIALKHWIKGALHMKQRHLAKTQILMGATLCLLLA